MTVLDVTVDRTAALGAVPGWLREEAAPLVGTPATFTVPPGDAFSGTRSALVDGPCGRAFVKWADQAVKERFIEAERQALTHLANSGVSGVARPIIGAGGRGLWIQRVTPADRPWSERDADAALAVLDRLAGVPLPSGSFSDMRLAIPENLAARVHLVRDQLGADAAMFAAGIEEYRRTVRPARQIICHGDAHDSNWIITAAGPVLVDFETMTAGPAGWDATVLLCHLDLDDRWRARRVIEACGSETRAVACVAAATLKQYGMWLADDPAIRAVSIRNLPTHLRLWHAVASPSVAAT